MAGNLREHNGTRALARWILLISAGPSNFANAANGAGTARGLACCDHLRRPPACRCPLSPTTSAATRPPSRAVRLWGRFSSTTARRACSRRDRAQILPSHQPVTWRPFVSRPSPP
ncbi:hypothetical protein BDU57DRAFT_128432 [Ampelomyces quisqualis]|uniref:Uncharacterized protein n=1 Tax=Ampelomyces quisqualis TaxID=50730 RepID=A0A6A5QTQ9_AMPQU|nr:hypothetical protein BDU57DRAFT_128432 [Ampelomyces quisqualis]